ncbi:hypothetical protein Gotri_024094 [Gossypium trilobum]|uniref:Uncharacterized protein n=1 Tax=Gossypium trilobum TaxID=34281 RepID=A0A7J9DLJ2_9ROSI|nr:hypothetical protein [Gossypium trilobum]
MLQVINLMKKILQQMKMKIYKYQNQWILVKHIIILMEKEN